MNNFCVRRTKENFEEVNTFFNTLYKTTAFKKRKNLGKFLENGQRTGFDFLCYPKEDNRAQRNYQPGNYHEVTLKALKGIINLQNSVDKMNEETKKVKFSTLGDKDAIIVKNEREFKTVIQAIRNNPGYSCPNYTGEFGIGATSGGHADLTWYRSKGYTLYNFEAVDFLSGDRLIGYKCPMDLFGQKVLKGDVFKRAGVNSDFYKGDRNTGDAYQMPREIVETWEPVYEENFFIWDWVIRDTAHTPIAVQITAIEANRFLVGSTGHIPFSDKPLWRKATQEEIKKANVIVFGGREAEFTEFGLAKFGCQHFSKDQLQAYFELINREGANFEIRVNGQAVTKELLIRLIARLK